MQVRCRTLFAAFGAAMVAGWGCNNNGNNNDAGNADSGNPGQDAGGNDAGNTGNDAGSDAGTDAGQQTMTLTATRTIHYLTETGQVDRPYDFSTQPVAALVPAANADSGYVVYPGTGTDAGTLSIPNVPNTVTSYYLQFGFNWVQATSPSIDLSFYSGGRPDLDFADAGTAVQCNLTGLTPWQKTSDLIQLTSQGAGLVANLALAANEPDSGSTAFDATVSLARRSRVEATKGDLAFVFQMARQTDAGDIASSLGASTAFQPAGFTVADGTATVLDAGMQALNQQSAKWTFSGTSFSPLGDPAWTAFSQVAGVSATYSAGAHGAVAPSPGILLFDTLNPQTTDFDMGATYGNPFPSNFGLFGFAEENWQIVKTFTGALPDGGDLLDTEVLQNIAVDALASFPPADGGTLMPLVGPPTGLLADGADATVDGPLASVSPVLSWTAPASLAAPSFYRVTVDHVTARANGAASHFTLNIWTRATTVQLFPGLLLPGGNNYLIHVSAIYRPNGTYPFLTSFPDARADTLSGILTTP